MYYASVFRVFAFFAMLVDVNDVDKKIERYFGERRRSTSYFIGRFILLKIEQYLVIDFK